MKQQPSVADLQSWLGDIDIYLVDQLMKGRIAPGARVLDAGCGGGRNLVFLMQAGYEVHGVDEDPAAIDLVRRIARRTAPELPADNFRVESLEKSSLPEKHFDVVICNAVLHFARDRQQFLAMLFGAWKPLKPGGLFFARLATRIGIEHLVQPLQDGRFLSPDNSRLYLADFDELLTLTQELKGELVDPIKTTNVHNRRCMTTWVLTRHA